MLFEGAFRVTKSTRDESDELKREAANARRAAAVVRTRYERREAVLGVFNSIRNTEHEIMVRRGQGVDETPSRDYLARYIPEAADTLLTDVDPEKAREFKSLPSIDALTGQELTAALGAHMNYLVAWAAD